MEEPDRLAERFDEQRGGLHAIAYRMLGSSVEAEDAVQEAWLRLARACPGDIENLLGWLRTVVTRICLDMLRSRAARREDLPGELPDGYATGSGHGAGGVGVPDGLPGSGGPGGGAPEEQAVLADAVSRALLVVLDTLEPAERVAFVLHDMFGVPFGQIAPIVERTPAATKKLASRARQKVRGTPAVPAERLAQQRRVVSAFLAAARDGDLAGVLNVLAPDVVRRSDPAALRPGGAAVVRGARNVAEGTVRNMARARLAELALIDGEVGAIVVTRGRPWIALTFTVEDGAITSYDVIADPVRLRNLSLAVVDV
ncbi:MAG: sigma-70 family RNA polymerase sigma factor [Nocardiopsaceae bacterium]|nr:sigma-70 family RNA polymerase sigma factor [Nocardiopsaceae bacterium]